jgi:hypothetical protein
MFGFLLPTCFGISLNIKKTSAKSICMFVKGTTIGKSHSIRQSIIIAMLKNNFSVSLFN